MSTALRNPEPESAFPRLLELTVRGCEVARLSAAAAAQAIAARSAQDAERIRGYEEELDRLDREINEGVTAEITRCAGTEARQLLSCLKFIIELERIGDLLLNFSNRVQACAARLQDRDKHDLTNMAKILARMLGEAKAAFEKRDLNRALGVLRADSELDRLRNLAFVRHIENPDKEPRQEGFQVVFMAQTLERAGDHAKNLAEEVCHLVSGHSIRHLLRAHDKPFEQMFLDWMRQRDVNK
jgi:phosphate transport system protein